MRSDDWLSRLWHKHWGCLVLLAVYLAVTVPYGILNPLGEAPDEVAHMDIVRFIAREHHLPTDVAERRIAGRKSDWPLLYHAVVGIATSWVDDGPLPQTKLNDSSLTRVLITDDVSPFALIHTDDEAFPYQGIVLHWHLARLISTLFGAATLVIVYITGLSIFPGDQWTALAMAAMVVAIPQFRLISSAVNDDNLLALLSALFVLMLMKALSAPTRVSTYVWSGVFLGLALTTKYSVGLLPLLIVAVLIVAYRQGRLNRRAALVRFAVFAIALAIVVAWWFIYVETYFNQTQDLGLLPGLVKPLLVGDGSDRTSDRVADLMTTGALPAGGAEISGLSLWRWGVRLFQSFWLTAGQQMTITLDTGFYLGFLLLLLLALGGLLRAWLNKKNLPWQAIGLLGLQVLLLLPFLLLRFYVTGSPEEAGQGRHILLPAASAVGLALAVGVSTWLPPRWRRVGTFGMIGVLFVFGQVLLHCYVLPSYPPPLPVRTSVDAAQHVPNPIRLNLAAGIDLVGYEVSPPNAHNALRVTLVWRCTEKPKQDYLVSVLLTDERGSVGSYWVGHPVDGRYPTRAWVPGDVVRDTVWLPLSETVGGDYSLRIALQPDEAPLLLSKTEGGLPWEFPGVLLTTVTVPGGPARSFSRYLSASHGGQIGFDVWQAGVPTAGPPLYQYRSSIPVTVEGATAGTVSLVGVDGVAHDPLAQANNTALFLVDAHWKNGEYRLRVDTGSETLESQSVVRVQQRERSFAVPGMMYEAKADFGNDMVLLGYDLPDRRMQRGGALPITVYWQALRTMSREYVVFCDLLADTDLRQWGSVDRVPLGYYSTMAWAPGEVIKDEFAIGVRPDAPEGVYRLHLGVYSVIAGQPQYLPLLAGGSPTGVNHVVIGPIKVGGAPPGAVIEAPSPQTSLNVGLGDGLVTLIGYDWAVSEDALDVVLYWRCDNRIGLDYHTFVHLRGVDGSPTITPGTIVAQNDQPAGGGIYPSSLWESGEVIRDAVHIPLPPVLPSGAYELVVGLYDPASGVRLPVAGSGDNSVLLKQIVR